jgi:predicted kinase
MPRTKFCMLLVGLPGAGKTSVATLMKRIDDSVTILGNDQIRRKIGIPADDSEQTERIYGLLAYEAVEALHRSRVVVLDATFYLRRYREIIYRIVRNTNMVWGHVHSPIHLCRSRVAERATSSADPYEGMCDIQRFDRRVLENQEIGSEESLTFSYRIGFECSATRPRVVELPETVPNELRFLVHPEFH